jgi:Zn finger protein HypA/HybF involved in hydrogenase expression
MKRAELISMIREVSISGKTYEEYVEAVADRLYIEGARLIGYWEEENRLRRSAKFLCSICGGLAYFPQPTRSDTWQKCCPYRYCPNCGSKMLDITNENN